MDLSDRDRILVEHFLPSQQSMRIAVVTETWPPEVNGVALTLAKLVHGLCQRNHAVQLIRPRQDKNETALAQDDMSELLLTGLPIPRYPQLKLGLPSKKALIRAWTLRRPDLVHIATEGPLGWSALQAARRLRLPVTSDFRTNFHSYSKHYGVGWLRKPIVAYLRKFHNNTACTMVPTHLLKSELQKLGFDNLRVVARGVDTEMFNPRHRSEALRQSWGADADTLVLLSVGRLAPEKNLDLVIKTYQALRAAQRPVRLVLAGDGPYRAELQARCPDAVFLGMCDHQTLSSIYPSADVFLFPSLTETFGNVTLEALACGTPVLAFDSAAASELVQNDRNGWLVQGEREEDFLAKALEMTRDTARLMGMRAQTSESVSALDWLQIVMQVENIFLQTQTTAPQA
jgi:glycosyltransferase involved in cell wall biosynthesis